MKIIAIDSATEACSAALYWDGQIAERFTESSKGQGTILLGMVEALLTEAGGCLQDLDILACGRGPGAFTGIRVALSMTQAFAFAVDLPVVPISNLAILAQGLYRQQGKARILAALDARMQEVYLGGYAIVNGLAQEIMTEQLLSLDALNIPLEGTWHAVGRGWQAQNDKLAQKLGHHVASTSDGLCHAQDLTPFAIDAVKHGKTITPELITACYLRDNVAKKSQNKIV